MSARRVFPQVAELDVESQQYPALILGGCRHSGIGLREEAFLGRRGYVMPEIAQSLRQVARKVLVEFQPHCPTGTFHMFSRESSAP